MPVYEYKVLDPSGRKSSGIIDAESAAMARRKLRSSGVYPVEVRESEARRSGRIAVSGIFQRIREAELSTATRHISVLLKAGLPLLMALDAVIAQGGSAGLKRVLSQVKDAINQGGTLASALSEHPKVFTSAYVSMVRAGETSGTLDIVLERLAELGEQRMAFRSRLRAALAYPIFMSIIGVLVVFFLLTFIVPNITAVFEEMRRGLPPATKALIGLSTFMRDYWWALLLGLAALLASLARLVKTGPGRRRWDELKLVVPIAGKIYHKVLLARFGRNLGILLQGGVQLVPALSILRSIMDNVCFQDCLDRAKEEIQAGKSLSASLTGCKWFPPLAVQMVSVGERSGELEEMLVRCADSYEREAESMTVAATSLLEPVMILAMGLVVGFVVISILLPIFEMSRMIR